MVAVAAGRGSGKTELARRRIVRYLNVKKTWSNPIYVYALPTYKQAKRVAWHELKLLIPKHWIKSINIVELTIETVFGSQLIVAGMDKPERIEGLQIDGCVLDESCDMKPGVFTRTIVPMTTHRGAWVWRIGAIKRFGVGATDFKEFFDDQAEESYTWPSEDILTPEDLSYARANSEPRDYNEQYRARWEKATGGIFYCFDDVLDVGDPVYDPGRPLLIGSDFNVDPMSWVIAQASEGNKHLSILDELFIRNTNTKQTLSALHGKYGRHQAGFEFYGDATGRARKSSADTSDYIQIANDTRFVNARCYYPRANPPIVSRFSACNAIFENASGDRRCTIHHRCKQLIKDLKRRNYKPNSREPDDYGDIGHMTDAFGYLVHARFPVHVIRKSIPMVAAT